MAPPPFAQDVHVDIVSELNRISRQRYPTEFDFHNDLYQTIKRLQDGHTVFLDLCYDSTYLSYLPFPIVAVTENGRQQIRIAPEAFDVVSVAFKDIIDDWQSSSGLNFSRYSGAAVLAINGRDPWLAVNTNAQVTGSFQGLSTRQNKFFSSYTIGTPFGYRMGDFALQSLPMTDSVTLTVLPIGKNKPEIITVPYRAKLNTAQGAVPFKDGPSFRAGNCVPIDGTNGSPVNSTIVVPLSLPDGKSSRFRPAPPPGGRTRRMNQGIDETRPTDIALPSKLSPSSPIGGAAGLLFFGLDDGITGILALGSFQIGTQEGMEIALLSGLQQLKSSGRKRLLIDLTNNNGGYVCIAHWLHRIIVGPNPNSVPEAGLDTKARAPDIAQQLVQQIIAGADPDQQLEYNPVNWRFANGTTFLAQTNWLRPSVHLTINGRQDMFSQRLGQECQPFETTPPNDPIFAPENVVIVTNGLCASSCALFSVAMSKHYNVTTVVVGGKAGISQQYCGMVGGESSDFSAIDSQVKSTGLKNHPQAPPDFLFSGFFGITWRLGFGITDPTQPEEWQDHSATINFSVTADMVNNPLAIWQAVVKRVFK